MDNNKALNSQQKTFSVKPADILLPNLQDSYGKWAVVACDQFTSEREYWEELKAYVGGAPSTLNMILPEAYLSADNSAAVAKINETMQRYIQDGVFTELKDAMIYVERSTPYSECRKGIIAAIDLDDYSYIDADKAPIRATEGTVLSRIPPRVKIRENASIELPHIMLLMDDRKDTVFNGLDTNMEKLYDFELNMGGGSIKGYKIADTGRVISLLKTLTDKKLLMEKYGSDRPLLFAVGDGNHSLATAKQCWENLKKTLSPAQQESHPAKYALAEIVNIHDKSLKFEPIHRVVTGVCNQKFTEKLLNCLKDYTFKSGKMLVTGGMPTDICLPENAAEAVGLVQNIIDSYILENGGEVDYIHGEQSLISVTRESGGVGIMLPPLKKEDLFSYLTKRGSLPRKTFSMGEAAEKRYYIEGRMIKPQTL